MDGDQKAEATLLPPDGGADIYISGFVLGPDDGPITSELEVMLGHADMRT